MNRQRQLLAVLVVMLAASLLYAFWAMPRQEKAPPRSSAAKPRAADPAKAGNAVQPGKDGSQGKRPGDRLLLDLLDKEPRAFPGAGRDIFRFVGGEVPVVVAVEPEVVIPPPPPPPTPPPTPEELLSSAVAEITFLGFLEKRGVRTVFLSSGEDVYLVKAGEHFGKNQELIAKSFTANQLVVGWMDGPETIKVQLLENDKLVPVTIGGGRRAPPGAPAGAATGFPVSGGNTPRRLLLPQRAASAPQPEQEPLPEMEPPPLDESADQPKENISLEELLRKGLPSGDKNGK